MLEISSSSLRDWLCFLLRYDPVILAMVMGLEPISPVITTLAHLLYLLQCYDHDFWWDERDSNPA